MTCTSTFPISLASLDLTSVVGGGTSTSRQQIGVQGKAPVIGDFNVGVTNERANTDYKTCTDGVLRSRGTTADLRAVCGLPPSGSPTVPAVR